MMMYSDDYANFVQEATTWLRRKKARSSQLRRLYVSQGKDEFTMSSLIDSDPEVRDAQILADRAVNMAVMFGIGAIIDELRRR